MQTNRFEVSGYLASKPEMRRLPSGTPVANVRLGQTYLYETKAGRGQQTNWFNLAFYGSLADVAIGLDKGDNVNVVGSIQQRQFTPKDGSTRTIHEVIVQKCHRIAAPRNVAAASLGAEVEHKESVDRTSILENVTREHKDAWAIL